MLRIPSVFLICVQITVFSSLSFADDSAVNYHRFDLSDKFYEDDVITLGDAMSNLLVSCNDISLCKKIMSDIGLESAGFIRLNSEGRKKIDKIIRDNNRRVKIKEENAVASASNSIRIVNNLGGNAAFIGNVGRDGKGAAIYKRLSTLGIKAYINFDDSDSAVVYVFRRDDGERAMASYIGGAGNFNDKKIPYDRILRSRVLMIEGYAWNGSKEALSAIKNAAIFAKSGGVKTALGLGSTSVVRRNVHDMNAMLKHIDIIFGTKDEFLELLNSGHPASDEEIAAIAGKLDAISVITMGADGALIVQKNSVYKIAAEKVNNVACTVGAGDAFAGGFLYGYTHNLSLEESGKIGAHVAAKIVQLEGTTLD